MNAAAENGVVGRLLLDPSEIYLVNWADTTGDQDANTTGTAPQLAFADADTTNNTVSVGRLVNLGNVDIELQATDKLVVGTQAGAAANVNLSSSLTSATLTFTGA